MRSNDDDGQQLDSEVFDLTPDPRWIRMMDLNRRGANRAILAQKLLDEVVLQIKANGGVELPTETPGLADHGEIVPPVDFGARRVRIQRTSHGYLMRFRDEATPGWEEWQDHSAPQRSRQSEADPTFWSATGVAEEAILWLEGSVLSKDPEPEDRTGSPLPGEPLPAGHGPAPDGHEWSLDDCECYFGQPSEGMSGHEFSPFNDSGNWVRPACHLVATCLGTYKCGNCPDVHTVKVCAECRTAHDVDTLRGGPQISWEKIDG